MCGGKGWDGDEILQLHKILHTKFWHVGLTRENGFAHLGAGLTRIYNIDIAIKLVRLNKYYPP